MWYDEGMATVERLQDISVRFLEQAEAEYAAGDYLQASEKAWGAVAHYVKSVAQEQGWPHDSHYNVRKAARTLIRQANDPEQCTRRFTQVEHLHINFYDEIWEPDEVRLAIDDARVLLDAMRQVQNRLPRGMAI